MKRIILLFVLIVSTVFGEVKTHLGSMKLIKDESGSIQKVPAENASPGDILEYTFSIDNQEEEIIKNLSPTIPVPTGTSLVPETATPDNYLVSINGRDYYPYPIKVDGEPVELSSYLGVGWNIDELKPGEKLELQMQVKLNGGE
ncbi:MAG: hypothetical protein ACRCZO_18715 [Cetobacterium sp.]|uniref:hypothetical protein n=1 Tax=Cetobacterium sp. TaxID=2071632 RepID=UPI003F34480A